MSASTATEAGKARAAPLARGRAWLDDGADTAPPLRLAPRRGGGDLRHRHRIDGLLSGFPTNWVLGGGVPNWFDRMSNWVTDNQQTNFFLHHVIGGFANLLNDATNWMIVCSTG